MLAANNLKAQCITPLPVCTSNVASIGLTFSGIAPNVAYPAIDHYSNQCNGYYGQSFPTIDIGTGSANNIPVNVDYELGNSPMTDNSCATTQVITNSQTGEIIGGDIVIYQNRIDSHCCPKQSDTGIERVKGSKSYDA